MEADTRFCILGYKVWGPEEVAVKTAVLRCLYQARKLIMQRWQTILPPTVEEWVKIVNDIVWKERALYVRRGNLKKFEKMWNPWLISIGCQD